MTDFLLELRSEEIPARMQTAARDNLARLFAAELAKAGLAATDTVTYATPRRLALIARGLPDRTEAVREEAKGPPADAPDAAVEGFLRKAGVAREALETRDVKGRATFFAVTERPGRATTDVLAAAIPAIVRAFPWPKSMRWGAASASSESLRWVRPLHGIVALFGDTIVDVEIAGIRSGAATRGHRFHHPGEITIGGADDYVEKLRACHVIIDQDERAATIRTRAAELATEAGLVLVEDEGLVAENAGLTEWPVPLLGRFDEAFLDVPPEVIQLTARVNQKYFVCRTPLPAGGKGPGDGVDLPPPNPSRKREGNLANAFICTANIDASDGGAKIVEGNRKVLAARLADARFFYDTDLKVPLAEQAEKLEKIVFHEKLGTVADKVERVAKLARWLVEEGIATESPSRSREGLGVGISPNTAPDPNRPPPTPPASGRGELASLAERAARLAKADLVTGMVGEFPELQGIMGGYYAAAQGEEPRVAAAIRDHYKPVGQGDEVPTDPVTVAVSLADKLDTLACFYIIGEQPTGSKDPFALRRAALGVITLIVANRLRFRLGGLLSDYMLGIATPANVAHSPAVNDLKAFFAERLKVQQRSTGVRHDVIDAVVALELGRADDLVLLLARVRALQSFVGTDDGANLLAGYKRAANILKKEGYASPGAQPAPLPLAGGAGGGKAADATAEEEGPPPTPPARGRGEETLSYMPETAESALIAALDAAEPAAATAVAREDFEGAMAALAMLRAPIDAFFDSVTVNDPDPAKRAARLALLDRVRAAVHTVADFSRIEG